MPALDDLILWLGAILLLGGACVCMGGLLLYKAAKVLRHGDPKVRPDRWFWVGVLGFAMMLSGWGLWSLNKHADSGPSDDPPSPAAEPDRR